MSLIRKHGAVLQAWACLDLVLSCHKAHVGGANLHLLSPSARQRLISTLREHGYGDSASRGVPVYVTPFAGTHCA